MLQDVRYSATKNPEPLVPAGPCTNPACVAENQSLQREVHSLKQEVLSLQSANNMSTTLRDHHTSSASLIHRLKESNGNLESTLAEERERFEQERKSWISFKRNYATTVVEKLNDLTEKFVDQQRIHPLITLALGAQEKHKEPPVDESSPGPHLPQQSTSQSSHLTRTLDNSQPQSPVQVHTEKLYEKNGSRKTPIKQASYYSPLNRKLWQASSHGSDEILQGRNEVSPGTIATPRRKHIAPNRNGFSPARNPMSPRRNGRSPGKSLISPGKHRLSPRKNGITPARNTNSSVTRPNQLSLRLKPQVLDERVTPMLSRKRSVSSTASRPKLPATKWIRYSDRKARASHVLWNDHEDQTGDDVFRVQTKQDPAPQQNNISKPEPRLNIPLEPSSEDLPTTEESDTELITTPVPKRIPTVVKAVDEQKENRNISPMASDSNSKEEKMKNQRSGKLTSMDVNARGSCFEEHPGQDPIKEIHGHGRRKSFEEPTSKNGEINLDDDSIANIHDRFEIDPKNNFGVNHIFDEVARGKHIRKNMRARDCDCCAGYYEQAAKDLNQSDNHHPGDCSKIISEHQHQISRHRHFNPPSMTPPGYWQLGFPDTQEVENINQRAEDNKRLKMKNIQLQAREGTGPYRFKDNGK